MLKTYVLTSEEILDLIMMYEAGATDTEIANFLEMVQKTNIPTTSQIPVSSNVLASASLNTFKMPGNQTVH